MLSNLTYLFCIVFFDGEDFLSRQSLERAICGLSIASHGRNNLCHSGGKTFEDKLLLDWMKSWMKMGAMVARDDGNWWSDITASCALYIRGGIKTHGMLGLNPWHLNASEIIEQLTNEAPLSFHYVDRGEMPGMQGMHKLVTGTNRNFTANTDKFADNVVPLKGKT